MDTETREAAVTDLFELAVNLARLASGGVSINIHGVPFGEFKSDAFTDIEVAGNDEPYLTGRKKLASGVELWAFSPAFSSTERGRDLLAATVGAVDGQGEVALRRVS